MLIKSGHLIIETAYSVLKDYNVKGGEQIENEIKNTSDIKSSPFNKEYLKEKYSKMFSAGNTDKAKIYDPIIEGTDLCAVVAVVLYVAVLAIAAFL